MLWIRSFVVLWIPPRQLYVERFRPLVMDASICFVVDSSTQFFFICEDSSSCYGFTICFVVDSSTQFFLFERIRPLVMDSSIFLFCGFVHKNFIFERIRPLVMDSSISCMWIRPLLCTFFVWHLRGLFASTNCLTGLPCLTSNCY